MKKPTKIYPKVKNKNAADLVHRYLLAKEQRCGMRVALNLKRSCRLFNLIRAKARRSPSYPIGTDDFERVTKELQKLN